MSGPGATDDWDDAARLERERAERDRLSRAHAGDQPSAPMGRDGVIDIGPGAPARVVAVAAPLVAIGLVAWRAARDGLASGPDDPVSPWIIAVLTIAAGCWLGWRAQRQWAELRPHELRCRNLVTSFAVDWDRVESLVVLRRGPVVAVDIRMRGHRRRLRIGAATRFSGDAADAVLDMLRAHPDARRLLLDDSWEPESDGPDPGDGPSTP